MLKHLKAALISLGLFLCLFYGLKIYLTSFEGDDLSVGYKVIGELEDGDFKDFFINEPLENIAGKKVILDPNKVYMISFWASWCEPCAEEFPSMMKLLNQYSKNMVFIAISNDSNKEDMTTFLKALSIEPQDGLEIVLDDEKKWSKRFGVDRLPETFVFNKQGKLVKKVVGSRDWATKDALMFFDMLSLGKM